MVERTDQGMPGTGTVTNVGGPNGTRLLEIAYREVAPNHPVRVSTPVFAEPATSGYGIVGTPKLYPGQTVTLEGAAEKCGRSASIRLFARCFAGEGDSSRATATKLVYGEPVQLKPETPFTLTLPVPGERGFPVKDIGVEITGGPPAAGSVLVDRVTYAGAPNLYIPDELPRREDGAVLGWVVDADRVMGRSRRGRQPMTHFGKDEGRGLLVTGNDEWTDYTISSRFTIACADAGGLVARYQGLQRFIALLKTRDALKLVLNFYGETVLAETPCAWEVGDLHDLALTARGTELVAHLDGEEVLRGTDDKLGRGGAGYLVERGLAGFRETAISGAAGLRA
jgi:hypothetical protein